MYYNKEQIVIKGKKISNDASLSFKIKRNDLLLLEMLMENIETIFEERYTVEVIFSYLFVTRKFCDEKI